MSVAKFHVLPADDVEKETILKPNEIVTEILLPPSPQGLRSSYRKVRARQSWDFALAGVALSLKFKDGLVERARVVLSGAAPIPWRCQEVEDFVVNKRLDAHGCTGGGNRHEECRTSRTQRLQSSPLPRHHRGGAFDDREGVKTI